MNNLQKHLLERIETMQEEELRSELKYVIEMISEHELADIYMSRINFE